jgi:hypothetical protein
MPGRKPGLELPWKRQSACVSRPAVTILDMAARVSLRMVAAAAQVSVSTASMSLAGDQRITAATRGRVLAAAESLGYVRNALVAALASKGFRHQGKPLRVLADIAPATAIEPLRALAPGMGMAIHPTERCWNEIPARAFGRTACALVLNQRRPDLRALAALPVPVVLWEDEDPGETLVDVIETGDWWSIVTGAVRRVRASGCGHPALVLTPAEPRHWHDGVRLAAARDLGTPVLEWDRVDDAALGAFIRETRPDAVIGPTIVVYKALQRLRLPLPFASLILHDAPWCDGVAGWLTDHPFRCRTTLEVLERRIRFGPCPPRRILIPPRWRDAPSLRTSERR